MQRISCLQNSQKLYKKVLSCLGPRNILEQQVIAGTMPGKRDTATTSETATVQHTENWTTDTEILPEKAHDHNHA